VSGRERDGENREKIKTQLDPKKVVREREGETDKKRHDTGTWNNSKVRKRV